MRTIQLTLYKFNELSEDAQDNAVEAQQFINLYDGWHEHIYEKHKMLAVEAGFGVGEQYHSGFWSQGDGAMFTYSDLDPKLLKEAVDRLFMTREQKDLLSTAYLSGYGKHSGHYYHEHSADHHINLEQDSFEQSDKLQYLIDEHYTAVEHYIKQLYRSLCTDLYEDLKSTYYELTSRKAVIEAIEANDLEFYEDGCEA
jgi:hypothetical protein